MFAFSSSIVYSFHTIYIHHSFYYTERTKKLKKEKVRVQNTKYQ